MEPRRLTHAAILAPGTAAHLARATLTAQRPRRLHLHDFHELFWVQNGTVRHHLPRSVETLNEGQLVFVGPGQAHAVQGRGAAAMVVSVSLHPDLMADLARRHKVLQGRFFWAEGPVTLRRDIRQMSELNRDALRLEKSDMGPLAAEAFLLPLLSDLARTATRLPENLPDWLLRACIAAESPEVFREGAAGLVAQTGYAHAHVSRSMRRYFGQTPSDFVNGIRMRHAARSLVTDAEPLAQIAADCGVPNLSHFHKLFRAHHGMTPLKYRRAYQHAVIQPD